MKKKIKEFALDMERKLKINEWKGRWDDCDLEHLLSRLTEEKRELVKAVRKCEDNHYSDQPTNEKLTQQVIDEAADVANFAMMIADIARYRCL